MIHDAPAGSIFAFSSIRGSPSSGSPAGYIFNSGMGVKGTLGSFYGIFTVTDVNPSAYKNLGRTLNVYSTYITGYTYNSLTATAVTANTMNTVTEIIGVLVTF